MTQVSGIARRVDSIASDFQRAEVAEAEAMRDHLFLGRVMSEADVDPAAADQMATGADERGHWAKVQRMLSVMDLKEAEHRGKHHIETAIKNMKAGELRALLATVQLSLAAMHNDIDALTAHDGHDAHEADKEPLSEFDRFIALRTRHSEQKHKPQPHSSQASLLIGKKRKQGVLRSLDKISALHKSLTSTMQPGNPADHLSTTEVILRTPEHMKVRKQAARRQSLRHAGVHFEDEEEEEQEQEEEDGRPAEFAPGEAQEDQADDDEAAAKSRPKSIVEAVAHVDRAPL